MRPTDVPDQGLLCDLLWSDPDKDVLGWGENDRGVSFTFGAEVVAKFLHKHDLDLICRAHQVTSSHSDRSLDLCALNNEKHQPHGARIIPDSYRDINEQCDSHLPSHIS